MEVMICIFIHSFIDLLMDVSKYLFTEVNNCVFIFCFFVSFFLFLYCSIYKWNIYLFICLFVNSIKFYLI